MSATSTWTGSRSRNQSPIVAQSPEGAVTVGGAQPGRVQTVPGREWRSGGHEPDTRC